MGSLPDVRRRDWEDPMTVEWNKRHAHVPLHCHSSIEGESFFCKDAFRVDLHVQDYFSHLCQSMSDLHLGLLSTGLNPEPGNVLNWEVVSSDFEVR